MAIGYITLVLPQDKKHHQSYSKASTVNTTHNNTADQNTKNKGYHSPIKRQLFHGGIFNGGLKYRQILPSPKICIDHSRYASGPGAIHGAAINIGAELFGSRSLSSLLFNPTRQELIEVRHSRHVGKFHHRTAHCRGHHRWSPTGGQGHPFFWDWRSAISVN